jgi:hypothetical protein
MPTPAIDVAAGDNPPGSPWKTRHLGTSRLSSNGGSDINMSPVLSSFRTKPGGPLLVWWCGISHRLIHINVVT